MHICLLIVVLQNTTSFYPFQFIKNGYGNAGSIRRHSSLFSKALRKRKVVPILTDTLVLRHRHTVAQSNLGMEARQQNIIGAFEIRNSHVIHNKRILIIDDVFTTGATIREAVNELWKADPAEVDVLTLARTLNA